MAAGVAPMVSDKGSLPEVVQHESTGLVVSIDDPAKWEAALRRLLDDADLRQRLGDAARAHAETQFTWSASAAQTEQAFRQVLSAKRQRALGVLLNSGDSLATMRQEGQAERFVGHYLRRYAEAFDRVEVFSYGDDRAQPYANAYFVPGRPRWKGLAYAAAWPFLHRRRLRHLRLLRVMQTGAALPAVLARVLFGVPFVVTYGYRYGDFMRMNGRPWYGWYLDQLERVALRLADRVIVTTPALAAHVRRFAREEKIRLLPNGVDLAQFKPRQSPRHDKKKAVLFVGRLTRQKNLPLLVDALSPLRERVRLICVGAGEMESALREQAARAGLELEAPGVVPHEELPRWHHRADVFVLPSRMEGHPKALLEAMASGLPCVGVDAPGIRDVLTHEQSGLLVAPTAEAVRGAVERVLGDPNLAAALGRQARETASAKYDLHRLLDGEIALLREADGGAKPCRAS
jgi:glycosyltransferase involved in cell wall biosynthesis